MSADSNNNILKILLKCFKDVQNTLLLSTKYTGKLELQCSFKVSPFLGGALLDVNGVNSSNQLVD